MTTELENLIAAVPGSCSVPGCSAEASRRRAHPAHAAGLGEGARAGTRTEDGLLRRIVEGLVSGTSETGHDMLGFDLGHWHACALAWDEQDPLADRSTLRPDLDLVAHAAGAVVSVVLPGSPGGACMWMRWTRRPAPEYVDDLRDRCRVTPGFRVALGSPAAGVAGFRSTCRDARVAAELLAGATRTQNGPWLCNYADVAAVAVLCADRERAARLVADTLGELGRDDVRCAELRETLRLYLAYGRSRRRAAEMLHLARSTVAYRVDRAVTLIGRPIAEDTLPLRLALEVARYLGLRDSAALLARGRHP